MDEEEILEAKIEKAEYDGWEVAERKKHTVLLERQSFGSIKMHVVLLILTAWWTFGVGNLLYALYKYVSPEKQVIEIDPLKEEDGAEEIADEPEVDDTESVIQVTNMDAELAIEDLDEEIEQIQDIGELEELEEIVAENAETEIRIEGPDREITPVDREAELKAAELKIMQELEERKLRLEEEKLRLENDKEKRRKQAEASKDVREAMRTFRKIF